MLTARTTAEGRGYEEPLPLRVHCVVPAYRARQTILGVVREALPYVDTVVVVDDCCPEQSGQLVQSAYPSNQAVAVIRHSTNGGVGAAMKTGIGYAMAHGADIIVKIDADGQMDPQYIPSIVSCFRSDPSLAYVKGNRFVNASILERMPKLRFMGNAVLSLWIKFASGYWNLLDPTNGYVAFNAHALAEMEWQQLSDSYFFEISVLGELGLRQLPIGEIEMRSIYGSERSSLSIRRSVVEFPAKIARLLVRRIALQYFLFDVNLGTLYLLFGGMAMLCGIGLGIFEWLQTAITHHARTAGTIMLVALPILIGFQLLLNALMYDVQFAPKTVRELGTRPKEPRHDGRSGLT